MSSQTFSAHKAKLIAAFLEQYPNIQMHFISTYSSWLNQVELQFAKIERDVIIRGIFTSVADLKKKRLHEIRKYNQEPKPAKWKILRHQQTHHSRFNCYSPLV